MTIKLTKDTVFKISALNYSAKSDHNLNMMYPNFHYTIKQFSVTNAPHIGKVLKFIFLQIRQVYYDIKTHF